MTDPKAPVALSDEALDRVHGGALEPQSGKKLGVFHCSTCSPPYETSDLALAQSHNASFPDHSWWVTWTPV